MTGAGILVVGTTADYVDLLRRRSPGACLFLTDRAERESSRFPAPDSAEEVLADLQDEEAVLASLRTHKQKHALPLRGIACFDCDSLMLAARIAGLLGLPFPRAWAVRNCRSKLLSKRRFRAAGVACPEFSPVGSLADLLRFFERRHAPVVLKPQTGSGGELTFRCESVAECRWAHERLRDRLAVHPAERMYGPHPGGGADVDEDLRSVFVAEEWVDGPEYSADFVVDGSEVEVLRIARKILSPGQSFGTALAYCVPASLPPPLTVASLAALLRRAAQALGLERALCMVDFVLEDGVPVLLELSPRLGGDCLPFLIAHSSGWDPLLAALGFALGDNPRIPPPESWTPLVGLRLLADASGTVRRIDDAPLRVLPDVRECALRVGQDHRISMPPADYDSRVLGHVIFQPAPGDPIEVQCAALRSRLILEVDPS